MKAVLVLLVVSCAMAVVYGDLACGSSYCKTHPCVSSTSKTSCKAGTEYRANHGGRCACCPACVTLLGENVACKTYDKEVGETPNAVCREPLKCLKGFCTKIPPRNKA